MYSALTIPFLILAFDLVFLTASEFELILTKELIREVSRLELLRKHLDTVVDYGLEHGFWTK